MKTAARNASRDDPGGEIICRHLLIFLLDILCAYSQVSRRGHAVGDTEGEGSSPRAADGLRQCLQVLFITPVPVLSNGCHPHCCRSARHPAIAALLLLALTRAVYCICPSVPLLTRVAVSGLISHARWLSHGPAAAAVSGVGVALISEGALFLLSLPTEYTPPRFALP